MRIEDLAGKTLLRVTGNVGDGEIVMLFDDGTVVTYNHSQSCCESVYIESIVGDWDDLVGLPLLLAEEAVSDAPEGHVPSESETWTFYKFRTHKGSVDVRWLGRSNGYYSESVSMSVGQLELQDFVEVLNELKGEST